MKISLPKLLLIILAITIVSCSNGDKLNPKNDLELRKVEVKNYISSLIGEELFNNEFKFVSENESQNELKYQIEIKEIEFLNFIVLRFNSENKIINKSELKYIPDCLSNPESCEFSFNKEKVKKFLDEIITKKTVKPIEIKSIWDEKSKSFIWEVRATYEEINNQFINKAKGELLHISTSNGKVIDREEWRIL